MRKGILVLLLIATVFISACSSGSQSDNISGNAAHDSESILAPDFTAHVSSGNIKLSEYTSEGKPVMLYFFATWCPNCARDLSALEQVYPEYEDKVEFLALDADPQESISQIDSYKLKYPGLKEGVFGRVNPLVLGQYNVRYTTTKFGINKDGEIIYSDTGSLSQGQWRQILDSLIV